MFHNILLLAPGGKTVYQGSVPVAEKYFASMGFVVPEHGNPADYYMDVIGCATNGDFSHDPEQLPKYWIEKRDALDVEAVKLEKQGICKECGKADRSKSDFDKRFIRVWKTPQSHAH